MKKTYIILGVILLVLVSILVYVKVVKPQLDNRTVTAVVPTTIENEEMAFAFTYPSGEEGYTLIEPQVSTSSDSIIKEVYLLLDTKEYISFQGEEVDGEAPATVSIFVTTLPKEVETEGAEEVSRVDRLRKWAEQNAPLSSYNLKTSEPEQIELDGIATLKYKTDGLYKQEVYLSTYKGNVYVFTGQYNEETDAIRIMFTNLMNSVMFY